MTDTYTLHYARGHASYTMECETLEGAIYAAAIGAESGTIYAKSVTFGNRVELDHAQLFRRISELWDEWDRGEGV